MGFKHIFCVLAAAIVAACQTTGGQSAWEWQPIQRADSRVSIVGDDSMVTSREWKRREAGVQERLRFKDGSYFFYEELYGGRHVWASHNDMEEFLTRGFQNLNKNGGYTASKITRQKYRHGDLFYLTAESPTQKCFLSEATSLDQQRGASWHFSFASCRAARTAASLETDMFALLERMHFDGGELNRQRAAQ
jgi:hypothetical protein